MQTTLCTWKSSSSTDGLAPNSVGVGKIVQGGDIQVIRNTRINSATFDWGNSTNSRQNQLTIDDGYQLTLNSPTLGSVSNEFAGRMNLHGTLDVNVQGSWTLARNGQTEVTSLHMIGGDPFAPPTIGGTSPLNIESPLYQQYACRTSVAPETRSARGSRIEFSRNGDVQTRNLATFGTPKTHRP